jgi:hypothetical protein
VIPDFVVEASAYYLCEPLPDDYECWDNKAILAYVLNNAWQPFEDWSAEDLFEAIQDLADGLETMYKQGKDIK